MELKSLLLGILMAVFIFSIKSGVGMYYLMTNMKTWRGRGGAFLLSALSYGMLFLGSFHLFRFLKHVVLFPFFARIIRIGMPLHFALAFGMMVWSVLLLKGTASHKHSRAFWLLVVPCPVCLTVILLITAFMMSYFPKNGGELLILTFGIYLLVQAGIVLILFSVQSAGRLDPGRVLGWGMLLIASYFVLTVLVAPQIGGLDKIYRIAMYNGETELLKTNWVVTVWVTLGATFFLGMIARMLRIRRKK